jgi:hypothetical protein
MRQRADQIGFKPTLSTPLIAPELARLIEALAEAQVAEDYRRQSQNMPRELNR